MIRSFDNAQTNYKSQRKPTLGDVIDQVTWSSVTVPCGDRRRQTMFLIADVPTVVLDAGS